MEEIAGMIDAVLRGDRHARRGRGRRGRKARARA